MYGTLIWVAKGMWGDQLFRSKGDGLARFVHWITVSRDSFAVLVDR